MPTFIDESGDAGPGAKSSRHFRLAAVWFETAELVDEFLAGVSALRQMLKLTDTFEFHFVHLPPHLREAYLELAASHPIQYALCSFDKGDERKALTKEVILRETVRGLAAALEETYRIAEACKPQPDGGEPTPLNERIVFDQCNDPLYKAALDRGFRSLPSLARPGAKLVKKMTAGRSHTNAWLQLVDVICGAVGRHLDGESEYRRIIRHRELTVVQLAWNGEGVVPVGTTPS